MFSLNSGAFLTIPGCCPERQGISARGFTLHSAHAIDRLRMFPGDVAGRLYASVTACLLNGNGAIFGNICWDVEILSQNNHASTTISVLQKPTSHDGWKSGWCTSCFEFTNDTGLRCSRYFVLIATADQGDVAFCNICSFSDFKKVKEQQRPISRKHDFAWPWKPVNLTVPEWKAHKQRPRSHGALPTI